MSSTKLSRTYLVKEKFKNKAKVSLKDKITYSDNDSGFEKKHPKIGETIYKK